MVCLEVLTAIAPHAPRVVTIDDFTGKSSKDILRELVAMFRPMDAATAEASHAAYEKMWQDVPGSLRAYLRSHTVTAGTPSTSSDGTS